MGIHTYYAVTIAAQAEVVEAGWMSTKTVLGLVLTSYGVRSRYTNGTPKIRIGCVRNDWAECLVDCLPKLLQV